MPRQYSVLTVFLVPSQLLSSLRRSRAVRSRDLEWFYVNLPGISPNSCRSARPVHARGPSEGMGWDGMGCSRRCRVGCARRLAGSMLSAWPRKLPRTKGEPALVRSLGAEISGSFSQHIRARSRFPSPTVGPTTPGPAAWLCGEEKPRGSGSESLGVRLLAEHFNLR